MLIKTQLKVKIFKVNKVIIKIQKIITKLMWKQQKDKINPILLIYRVSKLTFLKMQALNMYLIILNYLILFKMQVKISHQMNRENRKECFNTKRNLRVK